MFLQKLCRADIDQVAVYPAFDATAKSGAKFLGKRQLHFLFFRGTNDCARKRMLAEAFNARCEAQQPVLRKAASFEHRDRGHGGLAFGERAGFVHDESVYRGKFF